MSKDRRDRQVGANERRGQLANPAILGAQKNRLLDLLERRRDPRHPRDVKERLVSRWKESLALSSARARKQRTDPPPAPRPAPRREPPKPPNPLRSPGRTVVNRIRREIAATFEAAPAPEPEPAVVTAPEPELADVPEPEISVRVSRPPGPVPSRWIPTRPSLTRAVADVAVQTAGTVLLAVALGVGRSVQLLQGR